MHEPGTSLSHFLCLNTNELFACWPLFSLLLVVDILTLSTLSMSTTAAARYTFSEKRMHQSGQKFITSHSHTLSAPAQSWCFCACFGLCCAMTDRQTVDYATLLTDDCMSCVLTLSFVVLASQATATNDRSTASEVTDTDVI